MRRDLFAFGVLLLEMCTGEKPTNETFNRVSMAKQLDASLGEVVALTLNLESRTQDRDLDISDPGAVMTKCLALLQSKDNVAPCERRSVRSFPTFIHADMYCLQMEAEAIARKLAERDRQHHSALQRLKAVEDELIEEQRSFEILVGQTVLSERKCMAETQELEISRLHDKTTLASNSTNARQTVSSFSKLWWKLIVSKINFDRRSSACKIS
ncbi:hypothetical protein ATCC90586_009400 [Pythium insidiosum]|nr:hypothetical protein ATCC90586_009400 [Pythium insidiosum]